MAEVQANSQPRPHHAREADWLRKASEVGFTLYGPNVFKTPLKYFVVRGLEVYLNVKNRRPNPRAITGPFPTFEAVLVYLRLHE